MKRTLRYSVLIDAPRRQVWSTMLGPESYRDWTTAFCEGSYYEGSWEQGHTIRFLDPQGNGVISEIAQNRPFEHIGIRHLGVVAGGVADTESATAREWAPSFENYDFRDEGTGTRVDVETEIPQKYEDMMERLWPAALARLKALCEGA
ncbi:SRPBCC domain-containing protein [Ramlibacter sp. AN1015]|uniref:SRPBCC family protein n=1 Tax=Ramlibacter sp. AN1015 TaxID=3133428 RepID=UPI0030BF7575